MYFNIDKVSYGILSEYLKSSRGYTKYEIDLFMNFGNGRTTYTIEQAGLRLCDECERRIMREGYINEDENDFYCEVCANHCYTEKEREDLMAWTEFH